MRAVLPRTALPLLALAAAMLALALAPGRVLAQTDVIRGRVVGVEGEPLAGVRVTATSIPGNVTRATSTNEKGAFQIAFPGGAGDYFMGYATFGYAYKQFELKRLADEDVLVADARLSPVVIDSLVVAVPAHERVDRNAARTDETGAERVIDPSVLPPELQGDVAAMAASLPGVLLVPGLDGQADGFSVLGLPSDQNSVTLNGMQSGAGNLPRDAAITTSLATSSYDVSRGGFSGANFNISSRPGSNMRSRGMSLVMTSPRVQWTDPAGRALGSDYTNLSLGGLLTGPIKLNSSFYNFSYQLGRQSRANSTLLGTDAVGLQTAGVAPDSVTRLVDILRQEGVPTGGFNRPDKLSDNGSVFGSVDFSPPTSSSGQSVGLTFNGNWRRQTAVGASTTSLASAAGDHIGWSGGLQARHSGYLGMVLSETQAGINASRDYDDLYALLPAGRVLVNSVFADGTGGVRTLGFGGSPGLGSSSGSLGANLRNTLSWFDDANKHRFKLTSELGLSGTTVRQASNLLGTFTFNSLKDLQAGQPLSFTRQLVARERSTGLWSGALSLGDSWRRTENFQLTYGLRLDGARFTTGPELNPLVETTFGVRNDLVPTPIAFSPRIGFSWTVGRSQEIASFLGAARVPRAIVRGGIGLFANAASVGSLGQVLDNTGLPGGAQQIVCVGPAAPAADWAAYASGAVPPDRCADGSAGTVFANGAPNVTLFARDYRPPRSLRSNLAWNGNVLDGRFALGVEGTYSLNLDQQRFTDLNFRDLPRFTLAEGRPVYVEPTSIVPATGAVAVQDARVSPAFAQVMELRSDLRSRTAQLSVNLAPVPRGPTRFGWSLAYTYQRIREQVPGFSSTAGDPLSIQWARSSQGPHQISYSLRYNFFDAVNVSWSGSLRSGMAFTPTVAGDVNGDGYWNDRAFVYSPANAPDPTLAEGMRQLLAGASGSTRHCLESQLGRIAGRNSCTGPWTSSASLNVTLDRAKFRMPDRGTISFSLSNPLGAADLLLHGSDNLHGWGQAAYPDQSLLYVRGFDPATRQYRYEVNQRFGATRPQTVTLRSPAVLTISVRVDLGPTRERQMLGQQMTMLRRPNAGSDQGRLLGMLIRMLGTNGVPNPLSAILRSQDTLRLTAAQADSLAAMNRRYTYRADSLWAPVSRYLTALPPGADEQSAYDRFLAARRAQVDMLAGLGRPVRELLTPEQRRKLPSYIASYLDTRYLALIRNGNLTYVGAGMPGFGAFPAANMIGFAFSTVQFSGNQVFVTGIR